MKHSVRMWLAGLLCLVLLVGANAALADGLDVDLAPSDEALLADVLDLEGEAALDLALDDVEALQVETEDSSQAVRSNAATPNTVMIKKHMAFEIEDGEAILGAAEKDISKADIPDYVGDYPVTRIADNAFANCTKLWSVTVPDTVTSIGDSAFSGCKALVFVNIADSVKEIGQYAFKDCVSISHLVLPKSLRKISNYTFQNCQIMWKLAIPSGLKEIGKGAFYRCLSLKNFQLPENLTTIGNSAFEMCQSMTSIVIPDGVDRIGKYAFRDCTDLRKVTMSNTLGKIAEGAFMNCTSLRSAKLPSGLTFLGAYAFAKCQDLTSVTIPGGVKSVNHGAFFGCSKLKEVTLSSGVKALGNQCFGLCKALTKAAIPESVKIILDSAFDISRTAVVTGDVDWEELRFPKNLKIYGRRNSTAQKYAADNNIPFVVQKILATSVSIAQGKSLTLYVGHPVTLEAVQTPAKAETTVTWKSSSSSVTVSKSGVLTPKHSGKATITVKTENGKTAKITVTVIDAKKVKIIEGDSFSLMVGQTLQLHAAVSPEKVVTKLTWKSNDKKIATVDSNGLVTAKRKGTVKITVKTANGKKDTITIRVTK